MGNTEKELILDKELAEEAKAIVVLAFRNGPIEDVHAGGECEHCAGKREYSHITQAEMKRIMKNAVDKVYALLWARTYCPDVYPAIVSAGSRFTLDWDQPERSRQEIEQLARMADMFSPKRATGSPEKRPRKVQKPAKARRSKPKN